LDLRDEIRRVIIGPFSGITKRSRMMVEKIEFETARNRLHPRLRFYGDEFVFDTVSGAFYRLSPIAGYILKGLSEGRDEESLIRDIEEKYVIDRITIQRDIELFGNSLVAEGLRERSAKGKS
jgi:predicted Ser/Thr protein kinase